MGALALSRPSTQTVNALCNPQAIRNVPVCARMVASRKWSSRFVMAEQKFQRNSRSWLGSPEMPGWCLMYSDRYRNGFVKCVWCGQARLMGWGFQTRSASLHDQPDWNTASMASVEMIVGIMLVGTYRRGRKVGFPCMG